MSESFLKIHKKIIKKLLEIDIGMKFIHTKSQI